MDVPLVEGVRPGRAGPAQAGQARDGPGGCLVAASPNYLGCIDSLSPARAAADEAGAFLVAAFDPMAARAFCGRRASKGADVAVAEGQPFGMPMAFGGPYLGMFAVADQHVRRLPGRLVGRTLDREGRTAYVTTLRAREQDIRRERALQHLYEPDPDRHGAMVQLAWLGTWGCASWPCGAPAAPAMQGTPSSPFPASSRSRQRRSSTSSPSNCRCRPTWSWSAWPTKGSWPGCPSRWASDSGLLVAVTEKRTRAEIDAYVAAMEKVVSMTMPATSATPRTGLMPSSKPPSNGSASNKWPPPVARSSAPLIGHEEEPTIFDFSVPGRRAASFRTTGVPEWTAEELVPTEELRPGPPAGAEISERDLVGHMTRLSHRQYSVDLGAYPLGSCTMKYNPKVCDEAAALPGLV